MNNSKDYAHELERQRLNSKRRALNYYYLWLYKKIEIELSYSGKILEIGAGNGMSKDFIQRDEIVRTEFMESVPQYVIGGIDGANLPFDDNFFSSAFAVDAMHHIPESLKAINELLRVTEPGGKIVLVEPYVSLFSYPVYKIFHNERTNFRLNPSEYRNWVSAAPGDGNQGLTQNLLKYIKRGYFSLNYADVKIQQKFISPFSFFATGGLSNPLPISPKFINILLKLENKIPNLILRLIGSRTVVVMQKSSEK
jgi:SAM-dependent methyltransferase